MPEIKMDPDNLYREESFSDLKVGSIRKLTPVTAEGEPDASREMRYEGQTSLMTPAGNLPLNFELPNDSLSAAVAAFPDAVQDAAEKAIKELQEMQRQASSRIQVPGQGGLGGAVPGGQGGSQIQL